MKFKTGSMPPSQEVLFSAFVDEMGAVRISYDGIYVGFFSHCSGRFVRLRLLDWECEKLKKYGVEVVEGKLGIR
jgi:hypothetical protein